MGAACCWNTPRKTKALMSCALRPPPASATSPPVSGVKSNLELAWTRPWMTEYWPVDVCPVIDKALASRSVLHRRCKSLYKREIAPVGITSSYIFVDTYNCTCSRSGWLLRGLHFLSLVLMCSSNSSRKPTLCARKRQPAVLDIYNTAVRSIS